MAQITKYLIPLTLLYYNSMVCHVNSVEFNRKSTGVKFEPYVLNTTENHFTVYSIEDIKTMLKVISTKFSRILTSGISNLAYYQENITYYNTLSEVYTAEAAATLNQEADLTNNTAHLTIFIGIVLLSNPNIVNTQVKLAFEAARKSHNIHPGTTLGLVLTDRSIASDSTIAILALLEAQKMKQEAKLLNLKIGIRTCCKSFQSTLQNTSENSSMSKLRKLVLLEFDFIICEELDTKIYYSLGITKTIDVVTKDLVQIRNYIQSVNPDMEFMIGSSTSSFGSTEKHYKYLLDFWTRMDEWGTNNNISVWMHEAFDNPWRRVFEPWYAQCGWWKLKSDQHLTEVDGYEEKVAQFLINMNKKESLEIHEENLTLRYDVKSSTTTGPPQHPLKESGTNFWVYVGSIIGPTIALVALTLLVVHWTRSNRIGRSVLSKDEIKRFIFGVSKQGETDTRTISIETEVLHRPYDKSIELPKSSFEIFWSSILGCGEFGVVHKAQITTSTNSTPDLVAVKMTKDNCSKSAVLSILSEIKILLYLEHHENLVSIKGAYTAEIAKGVVYVATELCELGSLKSHLRKLGKNDEEEKICSLEYQNITKSTSSGHFKELIKWSYEIACGMEYLAGKNVIHADLATRNVLLTAEKTAKITDFGLSRRLYEYTNYVKKQQGPLPWRWMAIEALKKLKFSTQSDVWSCGVTLWEIFSMGDVPYPGLSWTLEFVDNLETGLRMKSPHLASPEIYALMSSCWEQEPQNRPTFTQLKQSFARIIDVYGTNSDDQEY